MKAIITCAALFAALYIALPAMAGDEDQGQSTQLVLEAEAYDVDGDEKRSEDYELNQDHVTLSELYHEHINLRGGIRLLIDIVEPMTRNWKGRALIADPGKWFIELKAQDQRWWRNPDDERESGRDTADLRIARGKDLLPYYDVSVNRTKRETTHGTGAYVTRRYEANSVSAKQKFQWAGGTLTSKLTHGDIDQNEFESWEKDALSFSNRLHLKDGWGGRVTGSTVRHSRPGAPDVRRHRLGASVYREFKAGKRDGRGEAFFDWFNRDDDYTLSSRTLDDLKIGGRLYMELGRGLNAEAELIRGDVTRLRVNEDLKDELGFGAERPDDFEADMLEESWESWKFTGRINAGRTGKWRAALKYEIEDRDELPGTVFGNMPGSPLYWETEQVLGLSAFAPLGERWSLSLNGNYKKRDHPRGWEDEFSTLYAELFHAPTRRFNWGVHAGTESIDRSDPPEEIEPFTIDAFSYGANVFFRLSDRTDLKLNADWIDGDGSASYDEFIGSAKLTHRLHEVSRLELKYLIDDADYLDDASDFTRRRVELRVTLDL